MSGFFLLIAISAVWLLSEIFLAIVKRSRTEESGGYDKSSLRILWITLTLSITVGVYLGVRGIGFMRNLSGFLPYMGMIIIIIGLIIRWIAILTLRNYFTVNVDVRQDHKVIDYGIYRHIRHPAYSGSLLSFLGLGLSFSNWLSVLVIMVPITAAFLYRIHLEEKALEESLGAEYIKYARSTNRLIPKIF